MNTIKLNTIGDSPVVVKKGSQVQSQEKTVEITENGTTEVVPDSGFSLSKVTISTNVADGGAGNVNTYEYFDVRGLELNLKVMLAMHALAVRVEGADNYTIPIASLLTTEEIPESVFGRVMAVMFDLSFVIDLGSDGKFETGDFLTANGINLSSLPRITKEQFYNLEA